MSDILVKVEGVSKKFCRNLKKSLWYGMKDLCNELQGKRHGGNGVLREDEFWAVKDVSFELGRGECLGLIGPNGAGKSTLLKMLNGLIKPDQGRVTIHGRVGALIELGAGFNPILSGRENIYVNGSVLGFTKKEIDRKLDDIIDFADIHEFIDAPVQSYSSGMKVRLGFAVAAQMEPEVLLIDEVLAVGDAGFRAKCYNAISAISKKSAIIFVSHSMPAISRLATTALLVNKGINVQLGQADQCILAYHALFGKDNVGIHLGSGEARITGFKVYNAKGEETCRVSSGEAVTLILTIEAKENISNACIDVVFQGMNGELVAESNSLNRSFCVHLFPENQVVIRMCISEFTLNAGLYKVSALVMSDNMVKHYDWYKDFMTLEVNAKYVGVAGQQFSAEWSLTKDLSKS